uniref:Helicase ARIP4 n=1 Tax=Timema monikensis TaxID=170555 RepID=A0A7R9EAR1_9NEOP|nr:unnamed protein product [Timema monikensis]
MEPFVTRIGDVTIERVMPRGGPTKELKKDVTLTPCKSSPSEGEGIPLNDDLQIFIKPPLEPESGKSPKDGRDKKELEASNSDVKKDNSKTAGSSDKMSTDGEESDNEDSEMEDESVDKNDKTKSDSESEVKDNPQDSKCESTIDRTEDSEKKNDDVSPAQSGEAEPAPNSDSKSGSQDKDRGDTSKRKASGDGSGSSGSNVGAVKKKKKSGQDGSKDSKSSSSSSDSGDDGDGKSTMERKLSNMRRNIREVMSENQLDEETLAAQRQEMERLRRVQEQQRIIREVQRQIALNRQNNKTQNRVISILQGNSSILKQIPGTSGSSGTQVKLPNTVLVKLASGASNTTSNAANTQGNKKQLIEFLRVQKNVSAGRGSVQPSVTRTILGNKPRAGPGQVHMMTPSVSIAPVSSSFPARQMQHQMETDSDSDDDYESETEAARAAMRKVAGKPKGKDIVTTISSSSDDDCILLSEPSSGDEEPVDDPTNSGMHTNDLYNIPDEQGRVLVNVGHPAEEPDIFVAPQIARIIKPHQIGGVRFLYDNVVESTTRFNTSTGFGCILAHSMGLGKTLQVVCFCDIFLRHTPGRTVLCIMPINTLQNWMAEFNMWLPGEPDPANGPPPNTQGEVRTRNFPLHVLNDSHKSMSARARVIQDWNKDGGVLLIGYELYRQLSLKRSSKVKKSRRSRKPDETIEVEEDEKTKALLDEMHAALVKPGPDLVICDEGHRIKNSHASISQALKQIRSKRRVVLTGYPLQNNLLEYWCMVDFVRPNYLGTKTEFCNMFERPIQNGQCIDSTPQDIRLMRYRAHVLHSLLEGFVQRRSHSVLQVSLPQKNEYVLLLRMTAFQRKLYDTFMNEVVRTKAVPNPLKAFAVCCKIWNHPDILYFFLKKRNLSEDADLDLEETTSTTSTPSTPLGVGSPKGPAAGKRSRARTPRPTQPKREKKASTTLRGKKPAATIPPNTSTAVSDPNTPAPSEGSQPSQNVPYDQSYATQQSQSYDNASQYNSYQQGSNGQMPYRNPGYGPNTGPNYDPNTYSGIGSYDAGNSGNSYNNCADPNNPNSDGFGGSSNSYYPNNSGNQQSGFESQMGYNYQQGNNQSEYQCDPNLNSGNSGYWQSNDYYTQNPQNQSGNDNSNQYYGSNNTYNNSGNTSYYHNPNQPYDNQLGNIPYGGTVQQQNSNQSGGMYQNMSGDNQGYVGNSSASGTPGGIQQSSTGVQQTRTNDGNNQHNSMGNPMINQSSINNQQSVMSNQQTSSNPMDVQQNPLGPGVIPQNSMSSPMIGQHSSMGNQNPINSASTTIQSNTAGTDPSSMTGQQYSSSNEQDPMGNLQNMLDNQPNAINSMETSQSPLGNLQNMIGNTPTSLGHIPNQYSGNMGSFGNNFNTFGGNAFGMGGTQPVPYNSGNHQTTNPMSNTPNMAFGTNNNLNQANSNNPPNTQYGTGNPQVNQVNPMATRMGNPLPSMGIQSNSMNNQQNPTYGMGNSPISLENHDSSLNNPQNPAYGSGIHHTSVGNQGNSMISQGNSGYGMNNLQTKSEIQGNSNNPQNSVMNHQGFHHSGGMMSLNCSSSNQEGIYNPPWDPSQPPLNPGTIKEELTNSGVSQKILSHNEGSKDDKDEEKTLSSESFSKVDGAECKDASSSTNLDGMKDLGLPEGKHLAEMGTVPRNNEPGIPYDWAVELLKNYIPGSLENSAKMEVLFCILEEAMMLGDRLLVFSQSLFTLDLIEDFLQRCTLPGHEEKWARNVNYYRLDGSTSALEREKLINEYNSNPNIHLFLVSTRAGSLGINLVGANRVVVFDASWNPCHDTQAVCRVYRYGQKKPCFVYRLVMDNCLEKKIYDRQINKQGMADRVVDECNPDAHLSIKDVTNLCWDNEQETEVKDFSKDKDKYIDVVIQKVLDKYSASLSKEPFQHESLLVDRKEKKLSQAEKRLAKRSYELEKQASINYNRPQYSYYPAGAGIGNAGLQSGLQIRAIRTDGGGGVMPKPVASVRPMQAELNSQLERGPRSTISTMNTGRSRWIPAEVWQRQGMSAQEMTLPLDVVIPTNSPDRASIVLKAGQRVMVLKSPKGIYMQLENGKIIAIRTAFKVGGAGKGANVQDKVEKEGEIKPSDIKKDYNIPSNPGQRPNTKISNVLPFKNNSAITIIPKGNTPTPSRSTTPNRPMGKTMTMTRQETAVKPWIHSERSPSMIRQRGGMFAGKLTAETRPFFQQGMTRRSPATGHQLTGTAKPFFHRNKKITSGPNALEFGNQHTQSSNSDDTSSGAENILESSGTNLRDDGDNTKSPSSLDFHGEARFNRGGDDAEQDSSCEDAGNFPMSSEEFSSKHLQDEQSENSGYQESVDKRDWPLRTDSSGFPPENSGYQSENRSWEASPQGSRDSIPNFQHSNTGTFPVDTTNWERKSKSQATKEHTSGNFRVDDVNYRVARGNWNPSENVQDDDERNWQAQNEDTSPRKGNYFAGTTANSPTKWPITPSQSTQDHKDVDYFDDGQSFPQENRDWRLDPGQRSNQFHNDTSKYSEPAESRNWSHSRNEIHNIQRVPKPFDGGSSKNVQGGGNRNFSSPDDDKDHVTPGPNISHHHNFPPKSFTSNFGHLNDGRQPETLLSSETKSPVPSPSVDFHRHETTQNIEPTPPPPRPQQSKGSSLKNYRHAAFAQNAHRKEMEARAENSVTSAVPPLNSTVGGQSLKSQSFMNEKTSSYGNEKLTKPPLGFHDGSLKQIQSYPVYESRVQPRNETMNKFTESNVAHDSVSTKNKQSVKTDSHYDYIPAHGEVHRREDNLSKLYPAVSIEPVLPVIKKSSKGSKSAKQPANYPGNFDTEHVTPPLLKPPHGKTPTTETLTPSFPTTPSSELGPPPVDSSKLPDSYGGTQYGHNYLGGSGFYGYGHQGASPVMPFGGSYYGDAHEKSNHPASYQEKSGDQVSETKSPPQQGKSPSARRESNKSSTDSKRETKASSSSGKDDARSAGSPGSASGSRTSNNSARSTQASANPTSSSLDSAVPSQSNTSSPNFSPYSGSTVSSTGIPYESVLNSYSSSQYNSTGTNSAAASNPFTPSATGYAAPLRPSSSASAVPPYVTPGAYGGTVPYTAGAPNQYDSDYARASMYSAFHRPEPHHFPVPPTDIGSPFLTSITPSTNPPPFGLPAAATFPATSSASPHAANYYPQNMYAASPYAARPGYSPTDPGYYSAAPGGFNPFFSHQHPYAGLQPPAATPQNPERPAQ